MLLLRLPINNAIVYSDDLKHSLCLALHKTMQSGICKHFLIKCFRGPQSSSLPSILTSALFYLLSLLLSLHCLNRPVHCISVMLCFLLLPISWSAHIRARNLKLAIICSEHYTASEEHRIFQHVSKYSQLLLHRIFNIGRLSI